MNLDFNLDEKKRFNARAAAIIYNKDKSKILIFNSDGEERYLLPGGRIEFNESSVDAIKREIKEETGLELEYTLKSIQENFLIRHDMEVMQYVFCFEATYEGDIVDSFKCKDNPSQTFYWVDVDKIENYDIVPKSNIKLLKSEGFIHSVERIN